MGGIVVSYIIKRTLCLVSRRFYPTFCTLRAMSLALNYTAGLSTTAFNFRARLACFRARFSAISLSLSARRAARRATVISCRVGTCCLTHTWVRALLRDHTTGGSAYQISIINDEFTRPFHRD